MSQFYIIRHPFLYSVFHLRVAMGWLIDAPLVGPNVWSPLDLIDPYLPDLPGDKQVQTR